MCRQETNNQNRHTNAERTATNTEKLFDVALNDTHTFGEISAERLAEFLRRLCLYFGLRAENYNFDCLLGGQFAFPTDDILLCLPI